MTEEAKQAVTPPASGTGQVQLGIGTLIIIALIVTMCSGRSETEKVLEDTRELRQKVDDINRKLDTLVAKDVPAAAPDVEQPGTAPAPAR
jgi:outer membrane murein-binding lipoprotein Lpp